jgi:hypothetical protein
MGSVLWKTSEFHPVAAVSKKPSFLVSIRN